MRDSVSSSIDKGPDTMTPRRRQSDSSSLLVDIAKFLIPLLLSVGSAIWIAQQTTERELAVVKATEQNHFDEIQRSLLRIENWIARQEQRQGKQ